MSKVDLIVSFYIPKYIPSHYEDDYSLVGIRYVIQTMFPHILRFLWMHCANI